MAPRYFSRYVFLGTLLSLVGIVIIYQMVHIQTSSQAKDVTEYGRSWAYTSETLSPERGKIYDRYGHLLVGNSLKYEIGVNLADVTDPETIAKAMETILGLSYDDVLAKLKPTDGTTNAYYILADFISEDKVKEIEDLEAEYEKLGENSDFKGRNAPSLTGVIITPHLQRNYPEGTLASNVLGFYTLEVSEPSTSADRHEVRTGHGYYGIEEDYNDLLSGTKIDVQMPVDPNLVDKVPQITPASDLVLTIDREIQAAMEEIIDAHVKSSGAASGTLIVYNPKNGEILAMATTPRINPNEYWTIRDTFSDASFYNRAVTTTYEPGSVFKVLTMASAIDAGVVKPDTPFMDTGEFEVGGYTIRNWDGAAWGPQTMLSCMQHSLNVCLSWVATQLGAKDFYAYLQKFGIGKSTGIDLAGEAVYPLRTPGDPYWADVDLATNSFGQGLAVTPIQMVTAVGALANDGKMMQPHVLLSAVTNGRQYNTAEQVIGTPISSQTAKNVTEMLAQSLEEESSDALVDGYRVAGKTGTAEIPTPYGYTMGATNASFVGWGPVIDPQFVIYVWLEKPKASIWGSIIAAPVFRDAVSKLVVLMNIPPDSTQLQLSKK